MILGKLFFQFPRKMGFFYKFQEKRVSDQMTQQKNGIMIMETCAHTGGILNS
jgi:hypothetical protein